ncbi:MAG: c-type cytochrome [Burkholderiaceae bacterium]
MTARQACLLLSLACAASWTAAAHAADMTVPGGDPARGKAAITRYGCASCHAIPGISRPSADVGPPLAEIGKRAYLGGVVANTPAMMVKWLMDPPAIDPRTAMPNVGLTEAEAKDIAAYLYTLK